MVGLLSPGVQTGYNFAGNFLQYGRTKNVFSSFCRIKWDTRHIKKNESNQCTIQGVEAKKKESYQMTVEERYTTFRAKIEQMNLRVKRES